jgi:hypothetical protein
VASETSADSDKAAGVASLDAASFNEPLVSLRGKGLEKPAATAANMQVEQVKPQQQQEEEEEEEEEKEKQKKEEKRKEEGGEGGEENQTKQSQVPERKQKRPTTGGGRMQTRPRSEEGRRPRRHPRRQVGYMGHVAARWCLYVRVRIDLRACALAHRVA